MTVRGLPGNRSSAGTQGRNPSAKGSIMSRNRNESNGEETARDAAAGLDHATEKIGGTSDIEEGAKVGYTEENVEVRAQETATAEGFTLYRNPDDSHTAIDESATVGYASAGPQRDATDRRHRRDESATDGLDQRDVVRILRDAKYVMLTTALADGKLLAHPMAPQQVTDDADVWFFIGLDGDQAGALRQNPHVNIAVSVGVPSNKLVVHATLPPRNVMPNPIAGTIASGMLKPADTAQRVVHRDIAITFPRPPAVATSHNVQIAVPIDIRHLHTGHAIRSERANMMSIPRIINVFRLLNPGQTTGCCTNNVEPPVAV